MNNTVQGAELEIAVAAERIFTRRIESLKKSRVRAKQIIRKELCQRRYELRGEFESVGVDIRAMAATV